MMGRSHAVSGVLVGLLIGKKLGLDTWTELGPFASSMGAWALLADIDCSGATVTRLLGPVTRGVSWVLRHTSAALYKVTKGPRDENVKGTHRHMTHTVLFAVALGGLTTGITKWAGPWGVAGVMAFGLVLAMAQIGKFAVAGVSIGVASWVSAALAAGPGHFTTTFMDSFSASTGWLGLAVMLGCLTHCVGDALTESGCPFLFPLPIAGETWYEIRPPRWLRFRTNGPFEKRVMFPALVAFSVLALPGVTPWLIDVVVHTAVHVHTVTSAHS